MKRYVGDRTIDGVKVTVDGAPLDPCIDVKEFTKNGFEWSYEGPEPRQLALALLVDHLGDNGRGKGPGRALHAGGGCEFRQRMGDDFGRHRCGSGRAFRQGGRINGSAVSRRGAACRANADVDRNVTASRTEAERRAGADPGGRTLPHRSRSDRGIAALSLADRARPRGRRRRRAGRLGRARRQGRRSCGAVLESTLRALLLLRPRCADPVRAISRRRTEGRCVRRRDPRRARRWPAVAAADVSRLVRRILHRGRPAGHSGAEGDSVRPRLPDRLRRHDRRRRCAQSRRDRAWRHRDGDRLRRGRACRGAGRAARGRRRDHRGRYRSGETRARREDGRNAWRRCIEGRCGRCRQNARPMAAASMS